MGCLSNFLAPKPRNNASRRRHTVNIPEMSGGRALFGPKSVTHVAFMIRVFFRERCKYSAAQRSFTGDVHKSMKILVKCIFCVLLASHLACAAAANAKDKKDKYESLVQRVRSGDQTVDLNELRLTAGEAGIQSNANARDKLMRVARSHDFKEMAKAADAVLKSNYTDLEGHYFARIAAKQMGKPELEEFHHWVEMGLLKSLRSSGDGQSPITAMKVISIDEEYFILHMMGQTLRKQASGTCAGAPCDIMTVTDEESKQQHKWYFNVEIPMKQMAEALEKANK